VGKQTDLSQDLLRNENSNLQRSRTLQRLGERGNMFFALFGAVAIIGVLGAAIMSVMRGPLTTMVEVNRREQAKAELRVAVSLVLQNSDDTTLEVAAGGAGDGWTEGPQPLAGGPTGGGLLPAVGVKQNDPWGHAYGYCAWNHGSATGDLTTNTYLNIRQGSTSTTNIAIAVMSAGPNGVFDTSCLDDDQTPPVSDDYIQPFDGVNNGGGDDIVVAMTYDQAGTAMSGSGLWTDNTGTTGTIDSSAPINVTSAATSNFTGSLAVGVGEDVITDSISPIDPLTGNDFTQFTGGLMLMGDDATSDAFCDNVLDVANAGMLRRSGTTIEVCNAAGTAWAPVGGLWTQGTGNDIYYNTGTPMVGIGNTDPDNTLDVTGTVDISSTLNAVGATTLGSTLGVTGATTLSSTLGVTGATTLSSTLDVAGISHLANDTTITGSTDTPAADALTVESDNGTDILVVQNDGMVGIGNASPDDALDITGNADLTGDIEMDNTKGVLWGNGTVSLVGQDATGTNSIVLTANTHLFKVGAVDKTKIDIAGVTVQSDTNDGSTDVLTLNDSDVATVFSVDSNGNTDINGTADIAGNAVIAGTTNTDELYVNWNGTAGDNFIPATCNAGSFNRWDGNSWECEADANDGSGGSLVNAFPDLSDVPAYAGAGADADKVVVINATGDGVTFVDASTLAGNKLIDADGDTQIQVEESADEDKIRFDTFGTERMIIDNAGFVGIGTTTPDNLFTVEGGGNFNDLALRNYGTSTMDIKIYRAQGTQGAPSTVADGNVLGSVGFFGRDNNSWEETAGMYVTVKGTVAADQVPTDLFFKTSATNSAANTERLRITSAGNTGFGNFSADTVESAVHVQSGDVRLDGGAANEAGCLRYDDTTTNKLQYSDDCTTFISITDAIDGAGIWQPDGSNDYIEYDDALGGVRIGAVTGQPAPNTDWTLDITNSTVYTANKVAIGSTAASTGGAQDLELDVTGDIGATNYCDADGDNCFTAASVSGGGVIALSDLSNADTTGAAANDCLKYNSGSSEWQDLACGSSFSDARLKDVEGDYGQGLDDIMKLHTVVFKYKKNNPMKLDSDETHFGFVAQEVQKIFPGAVEEGEEGYLRLDPTIINVAMVNAIQDLKAENDTLKTELAALKSGQQELAAQVELLNKAANDNVRKAGLEGWLFPAALVFLLGISAFLVGRRYSVISKQ
jgi:fibronectin-binding autotransporter adhesin